MSDASGAYASPTGSALQNGGAGQQQGNDEGYENESFQLEPGEQNSGQESMRRASIGRKRGIRIGDRVLSRIATNLRRKGAPRPVRLLEYVIGNDLLQRPAVGIQTIRGAVAGNADVREQRHCC